MASRRGAGDLVAQDRVRINGRPPVGPGDPIDPDADVVTLDGKPVVMARPVWIALHKPTGYVTSRAADERYPAVFTLLGEAPAALVAVGRLDVLSEGLLLFTTDGELAARLMHPRWEVRRTYQVSVTGEPDDKARRALSEGIRIEGEDLPVHPVRWAFARDVLEMELAEGRSRVVRRVCAELGLGVRTLTRIAYGPVTLGSLEPGRWRTLTQHERDALYGAVQLEPPARDV